MALCLAALLGMGGCASNPMRSSNQSPAPAKENPLTLLPVLSLVDPFEEYNRKVFDFNTKIDEAFLKPVATSYRENMPVAVRNSVNNFFSNYRDLWSAMNAMLQLEPQAALNDLLRFGVNTTLGFYGLLDIAGEAGIERHKKDLGQTLARWGVRSGPYIVLPLYGPTTLRDAAVFPIEQQAELIREVNDRDPRWALYGLQTIDKRANLLRVSAAMEAAALDRYSFTRDAFLQLRNNEIWDGNPPEEKPEADDKDEKKPPTPPKP
jgi:phospholipid-binding lipoprotein MlaA